jgi:hypothetical protein
VSSPPITYVARPDATPEAELSALVAIYRFVLLDSQARKGGPDVLTKNATQERTASQDTKGTENADIYGN